MASSTQEKMERAEAAARMAAAELSDVNREQRRQQYGEEERGASKMDDQDQPREVDEEKRGLIGNILKSVAETLEQTVTGRAPGTSDNDLTRREEVEVRGESPPLAEKGKQKAEETKEKAKENAEEMKEKAKEKAEETKEKAREYKDSAKEKLGEVTGVDDREKEREDSFSQPSRDDGEREEERPGILGSLLKAVTGGNKRDEVEEGSEGVTEKAREVKERAKETKEKSKEKTEETKEKVEESKEKAEETKEKAKEYKDYTAEKAKETKDSTLGKMSEYKDSAAEKAKEAKDTAREMAKEAKEKTVDRTAEKAGEYKDHTAEKAKETNETAVGKIAELKDTALDMAKGAVEFFTGRREEETGEEDKDKSGDADDAEARRKMAAVRLQDEDFDGKRNKEVVDVVVVDVEGTPVGQSAANLKAADQMTGQTFNDVGRLDDAGKGVVAGAECVEKHPTAKGCPGVVVVEVLDPRPEVECRGVLVMECDEDPHRRQADK